MGDLGVGFPGLFLLVLAVSEKKESRGRAFTALLVRFGKRAGGRFRVGASGGGIESLGVAKSIWFGAAHRTQ